MISRKNIFARPALGAKKFKPNFKPNVSKPAAPTTTTALTTTAAPTTTTASSSGPSEETSNPSTSTITNAITSSGTSTSSSSSSSSGISGSGSGSGSSSSSSSGITGTDNASTNTGVNTNNSTSTINTTSSSTSATSASTINTTSSSTSATTSSTSATSSSKPPPALSRTSLAIAKPPGAKPPRRFAPKSSTSSTTTTTTTTTAKPTPTVSSKTPVAPTAPVTVTASTTTSSESVPTTRKPIRKVVPSSAPAVEQPVPAATKSKTRNSSNRKTTKQSSSARELAPAFIASKRKCSALSAVSQMLHQHSTSDSTVPGSDNGPATSTKQATKSRRSGQPPGTNKRKRKSAPDTQNQKRASVRGAAAKASSTTTASKGVGGLLLLLAADRAISGLTEGAGKSGKSSRYLAACLGEEALPRYNTEQTNEVTTAHTEDAELMADQELGTPVEFDFFTVFLKRSSTGGIGLRLKNLDGHAAVGGFSDLFQHENLPSHSSDENSAPSYRCAGDIKVNDIIVAVGSLDAISPKTCPFEKVVQYLTQCNSSRDPKRGLGGVGHAATSGSYNSWDPDSANVQNKAKSTQHALLQDTICIRFARARSIPEGHENLHLALTSSAEEGQVPLHHGEESGGQDEEENRRQENTSLKPKATKGGKAKKKTGVASVSTAPQRRTRSSSLVKETSEV